MPTTQPIDYRLAQQTLHDILRHDFSKREQNVLLTIWARSYFVGQASAYLPRGFGELVGIETSKAKQVVRNLIAMHVIQADVSEASYTLLPDVQLWNVRPLVPAAPASGAVQNLLPEYERELSSAVAEVNRVAALASPSPENRPVAEYLADLRRAVDDPASVTAADPPEDTPPRRETSQHGGNPAATAAEKPPPRRKSGHAGGTSLSFSSAEASSKKLLSLAKAGTATTETPDLVLQGELCRVIGTRAFQRFPQWRRMLERDPDYVRSLISEYHYKKHNGIEIESPGGFLARIARDEKRWPEGR